jgi:hypothetical protein
VIGRLNCPPFLVLDLSLNIPNRVRRFNIKGNSFPLECLDKDLKFIVGTKVQPESGVRLYVVLRKGTFIFKFCLSEEKTLPVWGEPAQYVSATNIVRENCSHPFSPRILALTSLIVSDESTMRLIVFSPGILTKIWISLRRRRTKWRVDSACML